MCWTVRAACFRWRHEPKSTCRTVCSWGVFVTNWTGRRAPAGLWLFMSVARAVSLGAEAEKACAERVVGLCTLCFAHPAVGNIVLDGLWSGEAAVGGAGLLRLDSRRVRRFAMCRN